jgi:hypothetical protein
MGLVTSFGVVGSEKEELLWLGLVFRDGKKGGGSEAGL